MLAVWRNQFGRRRPKKILHTLNPIDPSFTSNSLSPYGSIDNKKSFQSVKTYSISKIFSPINLFSVHSSFNDENPCILSANIYHLAHLKHTYEGIYVDKVAQISVYVKYQAQAYCISLSIPFSLRPRNLNFRVSDTIDYSQGIMRFRFSCPNGGSIEMDIDIVDIYISANYALIHFLLTTSIIYTA